MTVQMNRMRGFLIAFALPLLTGAALTGCSSLIGAKREPFTTYSPTYTAAPNANSGARVNWQLAVETPLASDALSSARMMVMPTPGVLEVFPSARWSDTAPTLLRDLIVQGFENSGRIVGVGSTTSGLRADYSLTMDLRDFEIEYKNGAPAATVRFQARLFDYASNRVLAAQAFAAEVPANGADSASAFTAFQGALDQVIAQLVDWTLREGESAHAAAKTRS